MSKCYSKSFQGKSRLFSKRFLLQEGKCLENKSIEKLDREAILICLPITVI